MTEEQNRLDEARAHAKSWKRWGPYLSEREWGTVREDYSPDGSAWDYFSHDHSLSRAYRWNEDGLLGISDRSQILCFALALWNHRDPIIKERLFGLTGSQGNHGEDVKECYYFLDNTPTHSYMKALYKYPQQEFPYNELVEENARRSKEQPEFEIIDTGVFDDNRYFDVFVEYAKAGPDDILIRITVWNRANETAKLHLIPTLWFRNNWSWYTPGEQLRPSLHDGGRTKNYHSVEVEQRNLGAFKLYCDCDVSEPQLLFTENESNYERLYPGVGKNSSRYTKDGVNDYIVNGDLDAVNPEHTGSKVGVDYDLEILPGASTSVRLRLSESGTEDCLDHAAFDACIALRQSEADEFYTSVIDSSASSELKSVHRQALAGLLWSKQFYHFNVRKWLEGDPAQPPPPPERKLHRNSRWTHLDSADVIAMPDTWEYPWFAAWDLAFHCVTFATVDPEFAKRQLILLQREWYMHPNGQLPAYEWEFSDVNPPVQAWAAMRVYQIDRKARNGEGDTEFLKRVFHKLMLNFTWWVNRKDADGRNVFQGGFLGLDNIGVFDRSAPLPTGGHINQSDGTSWMAMYCLNLFAIAVELASHDPAYQDVAVKFLEHFFYIANAMNDRQGAGGNSTHDLWDEEDGFYYDYLQLPDETCFPLRVRSMVGLIPLLAVETLECAVLDSLPELKQRIEWFLENRPDLCSGIASVTRAGSGSRRMLSVVNRERLLRILRRMLDTDEFLSPYGLRALSRNHKEHPYCLTVQGRDYCVRYEPAESTTGLFGGNSNWRGPIWFPLNYLLIEALQKFDFYYGDTLKVECPANSGANLNLWDVSRDLSNRLTSLFLRDEAGRRPSDGEYALLQDDPLFRDYILFSEYFHGDTGAGLGASHQTGWTALIAKIVQQGAEYEAHPLERLEG